MGEIPECEQRHFRREHIRLDEILERVGLLSHARAMTAKVQSAPELARRWAPSVLGRDVRIPGEARRSGEADLLGGHGRVPVRQEAGGLRVPLAEAPGWRPAAERGPALGA